MSAARDLPPMVVVGVMSGTSLDGVDTVTVRLERRGGRMAWEVLGRGAHPYPEVLRARLQRALDPARADVVLLTELHQEVGHAYADAVAAAQAALGRSTRETAGRVSRAGAGSAGATAIDLAALSGQTVYHIPRPDPQRGWRVPSTLQLGEASVVGERCGVATASDFRQGDLAAGGQGAPLVPFSDLQLYAVPGRARAVQNIGGIANLTYLPADGDGDRVLAFDTGPGNCLIDEAMRARFDRSHDEGGAVAARGTVDEAALARLLAEPYFELPPPKTTGRELFTLPWALERGGLRDLPPEDLVATLTALTAESIARAYRTHVLPLGLDEVLVAGGGARNATLLAGLRARLPVPVRGFAESGFEDKDRETLAMAVMGYLAWHGEANVLPSATGARHPVCAGKLTRPCAVHPAPGGVRGAPA